MIPRIFMQTWKDNNVPDHWKPSIESIKKYMPNWNCVLMTDEINRKFVIKYFPDFLFYYDNFKYPIQRADAIRYMWLYINGGIYMDMDIELLGSLEPLFDDGSNLFVVNSGNSKTLITNCLIASKPGHPIWLEIIEKMKQDAPWWCFMKHFKVMNTTGPNMMDFVIKNSNYSYTVLPQNLVNPYSSCDTVYDKKSLTRPLEGSSWLNPLEKIIIQKGYCYFRYILIFIIIIFIIILYKRKN